MSLLGLYDIFKRMNHNIPGITVPNVSAGSSNAVADDLPYSNVNVLDLDEFENSDLSADNIGMTG
jgi:hypothetical protein